MGEQTMQIVRKLDGHRLPSKRLGQEPPQVVPTTTNFEIEFINLETGEPVVEAEIAAYSVIQYSSGVSSGGLVTMGETDEEGKLTLSATFSGGIGTAPTVGYKLRGLAPGISGASIPFDSLGAEPDDTFLVDISNPAISDFYPP